MAFFGRKGARPATPAPVYEPPPVGPSDLDRVERLLTRFENAVGNDAATRVAVLALSEAGGALSLEDGVRLTMDTGDTGVDRPWHWLVAVAEAAQRHQRLGLLAHLAQFVTMWSFMFAPHLTLADQLDMKLGKAPPRLLGRLYSIILVEIRKLDPSALLIDHPTGRVTVDNVLFQASVAASQIDAAFVDDEALAVARSRTAR